MGAFKSAVITKKGQALLTKAIEGTATLNFTNVKLSEEVLSGDIESKTSIGTIKQTVSMPSVVRQNGNNIKVTAIFDNSKLTAGYYVRNIGLYAVDPQEGEILFSISVADESTATADWMPVFNGVGVSSFVVETVIEMDNSSTVNVTVDFNGSATVEQFLDLQDQLNGTITTTTDTALNKSVAGGGLKLNHINGASEQKYLTGKNKFYCTKTFNKSFGSGISVYSQKLTSKLMIDGTATAEHSICVSENMPLSRGTYTVSVTGLDKHNSVLDRLYISSDVGSVNYVQKDRVQILTVTEDTEVDVFLVIKEGSSYSCRVVKIQIEEGEKSFATEYEEYCGGAPSPSPNYPRGIKNTFDCGDFVAGNAVATPDLAGYISKYYIPCNSGDYIIAYVNTTFFTPYFEYYGKNKEVIGDLLDSTGEVPAGAYYFKVFLITPFDTTKLKEPCPWIDEKITIALDTQRIVQLVCCNQLEEEGREENVITFSLDKPLRSTDSIIRKDGVIGINRKRAVKVLNGSEQWEIAGTASNGYQSFYTPVPDIERVSEARRDEIKSDKFRSLKSSIWNNPMGYFISIGTDASYVYISVKTTDASTVDELKAWLAKNKVEIEYPLATPVFTPLDTETQLAINNLVTFDDFTYVGVDSLTPPSEVELEYGKSKTGGYALKALLNTENISLKLGEMN